MNFDELNLAPAILKAVREQGYESPTAIQAQGIPLVMGGHDLLGGAQTGTGKTAAFTLPMLHRLSMTRSAQNTSGATGIRALVLVPTRELASQVEEAIRTYGKYLQLSSTVVFGGVGINPQIAVLKKGVDILVATPGRLLDLAQQGMLDLGQVQMLILDEADRMLDMGFLPDVKRVLALVPREKQSLLFSATFSDEIRELAHSLLKNPKSVQVTPRNTTVQRISQLIHPVGRGKKKALLAHIIQEHNWNQVLVFTRTKFGANNVAEYLMKNGITAMALHGNKSQAARTQALTGFKNGDVRVLVATDIAARGIDIDDLPHVVNYEIPNVCEDYVHRIGRTGRAGADGAAINLVCLDEEGFMADIARFVKQDIPVQVVDGFGTEPDEKAEPIAMGRQTIWGGLGKPPPREVMQAAARAARSEIMQRVRESRAAAVTPGGDVSGGGGADKGAARGRRGSNATEVRSRTGREQANRTPGVRGGDQGASRRRDPVGDSQPRSHESGFVGSFGNETRAPRSPSGAQPDPMRTSVDMMAERGPRRGGYGGGGGGRGSSNGGGSNNGGGFRSGGYAGGGNRPRGAGNSRGPSGR